MRSKVNRLGGEHKRGPGRGEGGVKAVGGGGDSDEEVDGRRVS